MRLNATISQAQLVEESFKSIITIFITLVSLPLLWGMYEIMLNLTHFDSKNFPNTDFFQTTFEIKV